ncbi:MAG: pseudouridine synthase [Lysobacter sp.]
MRVNSRPLFIDGVVASRLQLPAGPWATVLQALCAHFPAIDEAAWSERFARDRVLDASARPIAADAAYRVGMTVHYFREVLQEAVIPFTERVLHLDDQLLVVDKPHFLPVMPAGTFVRQTLLARLRQSLDSPDLVPLHRIDRATAGLVMFSVNPATRDQYQALFRERRIRKCYEALAGAMPDQVFPCARRSRLQAGDPFFRMQEVAGVINSESRIDVLERTDDVWRYALEPITGKKHQLRVHMAALGAPILNDRFYPVLHEQMADDYAQPLKLLARSLAFVDPLTGSPRNFKSSLTL